METSHFTPNVFGNLHTKSVSLLQPVNCDVAVQLQWLFFIYFFLCVTVQIYFGMCIIMQ